MELAARLHLKINVQSGDHSMAFNFDWIFILAGYINDNNKSLDELSLGTVELAALELLE